MIFLRFLLLVIFWSCCVLGNSSSRKLNTSTQSLFVQKPFLSLEPSVARLQTYKRFKRQPTFLTTAAAAAKTIKNPIMKRTATTTTATTPAIQKFQIYVTNAKKSCGAELGFSQKELQKSFIHAQNLTQKEKCLLLCILKRTKIMDKNNKLSVNTLGRIANIVSHNNALVVSLAVASGEKCNRNLMNIQEPCEIAYQISRCIANELKTQALKMFY